MTKPNIRKQVELRAELMAIRGRLEKLNGTFFEVIKTNGIKRSDDELTPISLANDLDHIIRKLTEVRDEEIYKGIKYRIDENRTEVFPYHVAIYDGEGCWMPTMFDKGGFRFQTIKEATKAVKRHIDAKYK